MRDQDRIIAFIENREPEMFRLLGELVSIQSGSTNKPGVDRVGRRIADTFQEYNVSCRIVAQRHLGKPHCWSDHRRPTTPRPIRYCSWGTWTRYFPQIRILPITGKTIPAATDPVCTI